MIHVLIKKRQFYCVISVALVSPHTGNPGLAPLASPHKRGEVSRSDGEGPLDLFVPLSGAVAPALPCLTAGRAKKRAFMCRHRFCAARLTTIS